MLNFYWSAWYQTNIRLICYINFFLISETDAEEADGEISSSQSMATPISPTIGDFEFFFPSGIGCCLLATPFWYLKLYHFLNTAFFLRFILQPNISHNFLYCFPRSCPKQLKSYSTMSRSSVKLSVVPSISFHSSFYGPFLTQISKIKLN